MDAVMKTLGEEPGAPAPTRQQASVANKAEYSTLCETEPSIPIFSTDWWLDATAGPANWDVALVRTNGRIVGAMPYATTTRLGMKVIQQPPLTSRLGPWIPPNGDKSATRLAHEQRIMMALIEQLPEFDLFRQTWSPGMTNWLPFYWNGFSQTTEYTYILPGLKDQEALWKGLESSRRKYCKQGERFKLHVLEDQPVDALLALHKMTMDHRGVAQSFSDAYLHRLDVECRKRNCGKVLIVVDDAGRHCAGTYTVWDATCAYGLIKGSDPDMAHTGAPSFCQWESLKFSATVAPQFDFLGNMNETIEPYVRSFGTRQTPVFTISKTRSRLLRLRQGLRSVLDPRR